LHYLEQRSLGRLRRGAGDQINRNLALSMLNPPHRDRSFPPHFEHSENPFYDIQHYMGDGKFSREQVRVGSPGGIFNIEFSADGKVLAAACERKSILLFDPLTRKLTQTIEGAHTDCVNCVRFLDCRTFATCSDDTTVALWDVRNLKSRTRTLRGHSNWVKNIEFHSGENLLVTSGFDGAIYTWDINKYQETQAEFKKVFYTNGLMRMRLTPDASKMVISTMNGYLVVIHDLDLNTMCEDLAGFKPNMYRLMQLSGKALELAINYTQLFHAKRNRVEIISDFPDGNDAEVLSSLRLHPQGWVALSRNTSSDEGSEWCCVHDIQSLPTQPEEDQAVGERPPLTWRSGGVPRARPSAPVVQTFRAGSIEIISTGSAQASGGRPVIEIDLGVRRRSRTMGGGSLSNDMVGVTVDRELPRNEEEEEEDADEDTEEVDSSQEEGEYQVDEVDGERIVSAASIQGLDEEERLREPSPLRRQSLMLRDLVEARRRQEALREAAGGEPNDYRVPPPEGARAPTPPEVEREGPVREGMRINIVGAGPAVPGQNPGQAAQERGGYLILGPQPGGRGGGARGRGRVLYFGSPGAHRAGQQRIPRDAKIHQNVPRLTHFMEESNQGKGFIKEQCFSPCGRLIASPFGNGIRLLGFNAQCQDLSSCVPDKPVQLYEVGEKYGHQEVVLSSAFSPTHWLLATGCLSGRLAWHQPVI